MNVRENGPCPRCDGGTMKLQKMKVGENTVKGVKVIKYALYLACNNCDNSISLNKYRFE